MKMETLLIQLVREDIPALARSQKIDKNSNDGREESAAPSTKVYIQCSTDGPESIISSISTFAYHLSSFSFAFSLLLSSLTLPPLPLYHTSPPHFINLSHAAVGPSTAGLTSKKKTGSPVGSGGPE